MSQAPSIAFAGSTGASHVEGPANVSLRGTTRGLEILIAGTPSTAALGARLTELLAEAPGFFAGSNARVAIEGMLPVGALARLEEVAAQFDLRIVEIGPVAAARRPRAELATVHPLAAQLDQPVLPMLPVQPLHDDVPRSGLAEGTGPICDAAQPAGARPDAPAAAPPESSEASPSGGAVVGPVAADDASPGEATSSEPVAAVPAAVEAATARASTEAAPAEAALAEAAPAEAAPAEAVTDPGLLAALAAVLAAAGAAPAAAAATSCAAPSGPRLVIGPVRSGRIVDHLGHVIVIGDVNPGAEVRAEGSIIVLGRLRGVAHAAIGRDAGCIIALSLQPQQLRIGRMVARAGDADRPSGGAEIAYATGETIVVERFLGRLPSGLAASM